MTHTFLIRSFRVRNELPKGFYDFLLSSDPNIHSDPMRSIIEALLKALFENMKYIPFLWQFHKSSCCLKRMTHTISPLVIIVNVYLIGVNNRELGTVVSLAEPGSLPPLDRNHEEREQSYERLEHGLEMKGEAKWNPFLYNPLQQHSFAELTATWGIMRKYQSSLKLQLSRCDK